MGKFFAQLKQKGPGGIPLWVYAGGSVILIYLGYRLYKNRAGSSGGSSAAGDNGAVSSGDNGGVGSDSSSTQPDNGASPSGDTTTDTSLPDSTQDTAPGAADSTGIINGPISLGHKLKQKAKKKGHASAHDHKQGTHGTAKRALHRRTPGKAQTKHAHAPKMNKTPHSSVKAQRTVRTVAPPKGAHAPAATSIRSGESVLHGGNAPPPTIRNRVSKSIPAPVPQPKAQPKVEAKAPAKKKK